MSVENIVSEEIFDEIVNIPRTIELIETFFKQTKKYSDKDRRQFKGGMFETVTEEYVKAHRSAMKYKKYSMANELLQKLMFSYGKLQSLFED